MRFPDEEKQWVALLEENPSTLEDPWQDNGTNGRGSGTSGYSAVAFVGTSNSMSLGGDDTIRAAVVETTTVMMMMVVRRKLKKKKKKNRGEHGNLVCGALSPSCGGPFDIGWTKKDRGWILHWKDDADANRWWRAGDLFCCSTYIDHSSNIAAVVVVVMMKVACLNLLRSFVS
eukprot:scaffold4099_cov98-Cylindrotheca_fusiformis.AAC.1